MPYKITIEKIETVTCVERGQYTVIDRVPWTPEMLKDAEERHWQSARDREPLKEIRGYAPDREVQATETKQVFQQTVEELNIKSVINAINS
jgi:hypothetical protein